MKSLLATLLQRALSPSALFTTTNIKINITYELTIWLLNRNYSIRKGYYE